MVAVRRSESDAMQTCRFVIGEFSADRRCALAILAQVFICSSAWWLWLSRRVLEVIGRTC